MGPVSARPSRRRTRERRRRPQPADELPSHAPESPVGECSTPTRVTDNKKPPRQFLRGGIIIPLPPRGGGLGWGAINARHRDFNPPPLREITSPFSSPTWPSSSRLSSPRQPASRRTRTSSCPCRQTRCPSSSRIPESSRSERSVHPSENLLNAARIKTRHVFCVRRNAKVIERP